MGIGVIGAGGMGCLYGGRLTQAGYDVTLLDIWQPHVDAIRSSGLLLDGIGGEAQIAIKAASNPADMPQCGLAIIFVMQTQPATLLASREASYQTTATH